MLATMKALKRSHPNIKTHLRVYKGSHQMGLPGEFEANVRWWLTGEAPFPKG
jgi:hypothetical protein